MDAVNGLKARWKVLVIVLAIVLIGGGVGLTAYNNNLEEQKRIEAARQAEAKKKAELKKLQTQFNDFGQAKAELLRYYEQERNMIAALAKKLDEHNAAYKKYEETVNSLYSDYQAKYQKVADHNNSIQTYWDWDSGQYKTSGKVKDYPKEPKYPDEPKFPTFTPDIKVLEALRSDCAELSNKIDDLKVPQGKHYEDFEDFKKYMVKIQISLSSQVDDLIKQFKDDPQGFDKEEFNDPTLTANVSSLGDRISEFAAKNELKIPKASEL